MPDVHALCKRFETDIVFDCHSLTIRYCRSSAQKALIKLVKKDKSILQTIGDFILNRERHPVILLDKDIEEAWCMLIRDIKIAFNINDLLILANWAKQHTPT